MRRALLTPRVRLSVHCPLSFEVAAVDVDVVAAIVQREMEGALPCLKVPLKVEINVGLRWGSLTKYKGLEKCA
jgi:DNA polymerase I-like protein with 3'-5' exonuclease and polymerase domains